MSFLSLISDTDQQLRCMMPDAKNRVIQGQISIVAKIHDPFNWDFHEKQVSGLENIIFRPRGQATAVQAVNNESI
jgi:hypothetical protein